MACEPLILAAPGVRGLVPYEPGKPVSELERELGIRDAVKLASNENPYGPGERARAAAEQALAELGRYPDGGAFALKRALARIHGVGESQITLGNGSNDVLELAARTFLSPGDRAVCDEYAFAAFPISVRGIGAEVVRVASRDYAHDLPALAQAVVRTSARLVYLANPNNPTGTWFAEEALAGFLARCPASTIVVLDEAYREYVSEAGYPDGLAFAARHPNLVVARTFSKIHGLAALRVGYAVSAAPVAELMNRLRQPFNVNTIAQAAACAALEDREHTANMAALNRTERERLRAALTAAGLPVLPSVGNFLCVEVGDAARVYQGLLRKGVIVRPLKPYGLLRHLRVTVGRPQDNARFLAALAELRAP